MKRGNKNIQPRRISNPSTTIEHLLGKPHCPIGWCGVRLRKEWGGKKPAFVGTSRRSSERGIVLGDGYEWGGSRALRRRGY